MISALVMRVSRIGLWLASAGFGSLGTVCFYLIFAGDAAHRVGNIRDAGLNLMLGTALLIAHQKTGG